MKQPSRLDRGQIIGGRYRILNLAGSGGMSHVYMAEDLKLPGKLWAVKESVSQEWQYATIEDEAQLLISLSHPRLPRIVDFFPPDHNGYTYLVMDFIQGVTLDKYFKSLHGKMQFEFVRKLTDQLLEVLHYLHHHEPPVVFRDLKPSNIMLTSQLEARLIDFGIARNYKQDQDQDTVKLGTIGFAAPEQYGSGQSDARSDLYSLGALLLYLVTGGSSSEWWDGVEKQIKVETPAYFTALIRKLLQRSPNDRFQSAMEVIGLLADHEVSRGHLKQINSTIGRSAGSRVVAVMGASSGSGVTHTSIAIAHYLASQGYKVALAEVNLQSHAFARIRSIVEGKSADTHKPEGKWFSVQGVDYWGRVRPQEIISLLAEGYGFIVLDMGSAVEREGLDEFLRAELPILVGSGAEWRLQDLEVMVKRLSNYPQQRWFFCLPLAPNDAVQRLRKQLHSNKVVSLPLHLDPFDQSDEMDQALEQIFKGLITSAEKKRRFRFRLL